MEVTRVGEIPWYFTAVYASLDPLKRQELWNELREFVTTHNKPWLIAADFNETRYDSERNSSYVETSRRSMKFNHRINEMQLIEVGNLPETRRSERLDRALCNGEWCLAFKNALVKHLPANQSDHCPIFISPIGFSPLTSINKPFRFQATWLTHENKEEVKSIFVNYFEKLFLDENDLVTHDLPISICPKVLRSKYCKGHCDIDMFTPVKGFSNVWKGITENAKYLKDRAKMAIDIPDELDNAKVEDLWEVGHGWKWSVFANYLNATTLMHIVSHELVENPDVADLLYWKGGNKGKFTIKNTLKIIRNYVEIDEGGSMQWELAWTAPIQQCVWVFLWLLLHDQVLCNANRLKRRPNDDSRCPQCQGNEETLIHMLRDCPVAHEIWRQVGGSSH
ncbi:hypothetical protein RDABS01_022259 [Bienertia sinuspersici]